MLCGKWWIRVDFSLLFPTHVKLRLTWGMVDSCWLFTTIPHSCQALLDVGDGGFDLHFLLPMQKKIFVLLPARRQQATLHRSVAFRWVRISPPPQKTKTPAIKAGVLFWWGMVDSNQRRHSQQIYSLSPLATREIPHIHFPFVGAGRRTRTPDLLITNKLLYQLSYTGGSNGTRLL